MFQMLILSLIFLISAILYVHIQYIYNEHTSLFLFKFFKRILIKRYVEEKLYQKKTRFLINVIYFADFLMPPSEEAESSDSRGLDFHFPNLTFGWRRTAATSVKLHKTARCRMTHWYNSCEVMAEETSPSKYKRVNGSVCRPSGYLSRFSEIISRTPFGWPFGFPQGRMNVKARDE